MTPDQVRCVRDRALFESLMKEPVVERVLRSVSEEERRGTRRSLLAQALRLSESIAPREVGIVKHCSERLQVDTEVELYVYASPQFNAACTAPEQGRVFVMLSSALAEAFDDEELRFVIGHELGHHLYRHHDLPLHHLFSGKVHVLPAVILQVGAWQRYAEISCDRAGALCCEGLQGAARALFKLSSGLTNAPTPAQIDAFLEQAADLYQEVETQALPVDAQRDWMASHPFSPVRLKAVEAFSQSVAFQPDGIDLATLEARVMDWMGLMEPGYLLEDSDAAEAMRQVLFAAAVVVADVESGVSVEEIAAIETLLGKGAVPRNVNVDALRADLPLRVERVKRSVRAARRGQVLRDLAIVARADDHIADAEIAVMLDVARQLEVSGQVVYDAVRTPIELD